MTDAPTERTSRPYTGDQADVVAHTGHRRTGHAPEEALGSRWMPTKGEEGSGPRVSVVVPCYRDEATLPELITRLDPVLRGQEGGAELVLVDDGSPDRTAEVARSLAANRGYPVTVVQLQRNFGQHAAVFAGFAEARGGSIVTLDSDLQHPPEEIPRLIAHLSTDAPVVSGYRANRKDPWPRRVTTAVLSMWLRRQTGRSLRDFGSMFRAYDRRVVEQLLEFREGRRYIPALVAWLGVPVHEVPITHGSRSAAGSRYNIGPLVEMALDLVTGYSIFPIRLGVFLALMGALGGFVATLSFVVYRVVAGAGISGLVTAMAAIFLLIAVQLVILSLLGEYVGRIYAESRRRPYVIVREVARYG